MEATLLMFDEVPLLVPKLNDDVIFEFPFKTFEEFPSYCGAGQGIGDLIVPETLYGLKASPVCYVHDKCWDISEATWDDFHRSNSMFLHNLLMVVQMKSHNKFIEALRNYRAVTYYNAVDSVGVKLFWRLKKEQGLFDGRYV